MATHTFGWRIAELGSGFVAGHTLNFGMSVVDSKISVSMVEFFRVKYDNFHVAAFMLSVAATTFFAGHCRREPVESVRSCYVLRNLFVAIEAKSGLLGPFK